MLASHKNIITGVAFSFWLHLFNLLFVLVGELSNFALQGLVLLSLPFFLYLSFQKGSVQNSGPPRTMLLFLMLASLCGLFVAGWELQVRVLNLFYISLLVYLFCRSGIQEGFIQGYALFGSVICSYCIVKYIGFDSRNNFGIQPNYIGMIALSVASSALFLKSYSFRTYVYFITLATTFVVSSRSSMLCILLLVLMDYLFISKRWKIIIHSKVGILLLFVSLFILFPFVLDMLASIFLLNDEYRGVDSGFSGRVYRWYAGINLWMDNPILGIGYGESLRALGFTLDSAYITILVELGLTGFIFYIYLNLYAIYKSISSKDWAFAIFVIVYMIYGLFEKRYFSVGNAYSILYLIILGKIYLYKNDIITLNNKFNRE